jgi:hypothetical protein
MIMMNMYSNRKSKEDNIETAKMKSSRKLCSRLRKEGQNTKF